MITTITARDFMVTRLTTLSPEMDAVDAIRLLLRHRISGAPVVGADDQYLGVFSERCSMRVLLDMTHDQLPAAKVGVCMDTNAMTIAPETPLLSIARAFVQTNCRRLPVVAENGVLAGQVSRRDVIKAALDILKPAEPNAGSPAFGARALLSKEEAPVSWARVF